MKKIPTFLSIIKVPTDFLMILLGFISGYKARISPTLIQNFQVKPIDYSQFPNPTEFFQTSLISALILILIFAFQSNYKMYNERKFSIEIARIVKSWSYWIILIMAYYFMSRTLVFSRLTFIYTWSFSLILILISRYILHTIQEILHKHGQGQTKLLIIGHNKTSKEILKQISKNSYYKIIGYLGTKKENSQIKHLGTIENFQKTIKKYQIDEIIQTNKLNKEQIQKLIEHCELKHIKYRFTAQLTEIKRNLETETISGIPIITIKETSLENWGKVSKRIIDIIGALTGFILLSPIFIGTALAIKLDSKGPILFTKLDDGSPAQRIGEKGKPFTCYKFRSMKTKTHNQRYKELSKHNTRKNSPLVKIKKDPRVTKVGKFIRKYDIDELPQLWNVLIGNMSLIGPRPHLKEEVAQYKKHHYFVLKIKPGLSGMAQISGRSNLNFEEEIKLDTYYVENWSLWLDIKILFKTIKVVLEGQED